MGARVGVIGAVVGTALLGDRVTKNIAIDPLAGLPPREFLGGAVRLLYEENAGAMLGLGSGLPEPSRFWIFTVFVGVVIVGLLVYLLVRREIAPCELFSFSLIIGGGAGNVIDRMMYNGIVIDFMNVGIGGLRTGVFNVADVAVLGGVATYLLCQIRHAVRSRGEGDGVPPEAGPDGR